MKASFAPVTDGLVPSILALWAECGVTRPWNPPEEDVTGFRRGATSDLLVATDRGRAIATVAVGEDGHRGWIYYLAVAPDRRGQGWGRAALTAAEAWFRARGVPKCQLMVRAENNAVAAFYAHLDYADGEVRVMEKWLDPRRIALRRAAHGP